MSGKLLRCDLYSGSVGLRNPIFTLPCTQKHIRATRYIAIRNGSNESKLTSGNSLEASIYASEVEKRNQSKSRDGLVRYTRAGLASIRPTISTVEPQPRSDDIAAPIASTQLPTQGDAVVAGVAESDKDYINRQLQEILKPPSTDYLAVRIKRQIDSQNILHKPYAYPYACCCRNFWLFKTTVPATLASLAHEIWVLCTNSLSKSSPMLWY